MPSFIKEEGETKSKGQLRRDLLKTIIKVQTEPGILTREHHIKTLGKILRQIPEDYNLIQETVDTLLKSLQDPYFSVRASALEELKKLVKNVKLDRKTSDRIRAGIARA